MLQQSHVKDTGHSAQITVGRLHLNRHTAHFGRTELTMPLSRQSVKMYELTLNSSGNTASQLSHLPERLCRKSGLISVRKLMSTLNRRNSRMLGINCRTSSESNRKRGKSHQHPTTGKCPGRYLATKQYFRLHLSA